jgi:nicotinate-nucleotide pyrophosphorylase (carboxylating)
MSSSSSSSSASLELTPAIARLIDLSLEEDLGRGDLTSELVLGAGTQARGRILCRVPVVACGLPLLGWISERARLAISVELRAGEGEPLEAGATLATVEGGAGEILRLERTWLNFLQRMSGVATLTRRFVEAVAGTGARIVDTRKTLPGWRRLDKHAVRAGGGRNHRHDLGSGILIKDNHIVACGGVGEAVRRALAGAPHGLRVEVEVESIADAHEAIAAGAELLLLDNMTPAQVREAVTAVAGRALCEISGGVRLENVRGYAEAGAALISIGALTHSAPAVDLSLELEDAGLAR